MTVVDDIKIEVTKIHNRLLSLDPKVDRVLAGIEASRYSVLAVVTALVVAFTLGFVIRGWL